ncbi:glycosyltransferase family 4 protein [Sphingomonas crocodyli]|uniref:Glycosyltransferase n=1 Tax=Sphingomonas crocodyli TaxID=1979270 RepID=A0A437LXN6_9SPHN|nr:glycosyltransferase family 1 protein [Sphingomonas crocodyli]RVT90185.1 glycosyltransferase [Sphingomonas crocodyli]
MKPSRLIDVDFSLAIYNRTGKYFIGRDLLETSGLPLGDVYYWRVRGQQPPRGIAGRILGKLQHLQIKGKTSGGLMGALPRRRSDRPLLHLDPHTVPTAVLRRSDAILCHDVGPVTHPALFDASVAKMYRKIYDEIARIGPHVIFVSQASQRAFEKLYPKAKLASSRVIYPPLRADLEPEAPEPVDGIDAPFLLTVGSIGDRKNQVRSIAAFAKSGLGEEGFRYVLCGGREPGAEEVEKLARETANVVLLDYVSDRQLAWLYSNAQGFVLASLLEGFGMPVSEAIARGQVALVSENSVLQEVAGDGAILVDPLDIGSIADGMRALAHLPIEERKERLSVSQGSLHRFSMAAFRDGWANALKAMLR